LREINRDPDSRRFTRPASRGSNIIAALSPLPGIGVAHQSIFNGSCMSTLPKCPACGSEFTYEDQSRYVCPECAHEWATDAATETADAQPVVQDAYGSVLADGDTVTMIKDLKVKGSSSILKVGTKVKGIRLVDGDHNIDCRIEGFGAMKLKSEFVKKA
jgi:protein PhnA